MALDTFQRFNDFYRKYKGQFLAKSEGHKYFFELLQMLKVKIRPKNGKKSTFQILKAHITKTIEVKAKTVWILRDNFPEKLQKFSTTAPSAPCFRNRLRFSGEFC